MSDDLHTQAPQPDEPDQQSQQSRWWDVLDVFVGVLELIGAAGAAIVRGIVAIFAGILEALS